MPNSDCLLSCEAVLRGWTACSAVLLRDVSFRAITSRLGNSAIRRALAPPKIVHVMSRSTLTPPHAKSCGSRTVLIDIVHASFWCQSAAPERPQSPLPPSPERPRSRVSKRGLSSEAFLAHSISSFPFLIDFFSTEYRRTFIVFSIRSIIPSFFVAPFPCSLFPLLDCRA